MNIKNKKNKFNIRYNSILEKKASFSLKHERIKLKKYLNVGKRNHKKNRKKEFRLIFSSFLQYQYIVRKKNQKLKKRKINYIKNIKQVVREKLNIKTAKKQSRKYKFLTKFKTNFSFAYITAMRITFFFSAVKKKNVT